MKVEGKKKAVKEGRMMLKEDVAVKRKQKVTERKNDKVVKFQEKIENEVKIDNGHNIKAEPRYRVI